MMWPRKISTSGVSDSHEALISAKIVLNKVKSREPYIELVARDMLKIRERNHFAEQLNSLMYLKERKRRGFNGRD